MSTSINFKLREPLNGWSFLRVFGAALALIAGAAALSPRAEAQASGTGSVTLIPTANAYTRDGSYADTNYGASTHILVRAGKSGYNETTFVQFNTAGLSTNIVSATLYLVGNFTSTTNTNNVVTAYGVSSSPSWTQSGITYNNQPAVGAAQGSATVTPTANTYSWDVTSFLRSQSASAQAVTSLALKTASSGSYFDQFYPVSKTDYEPFLVVVYGTAPAAPALTGTVGNQQATLTWNSVSQASTYNLYRGGAAGGEGTTPFKTGVASPYVDSGLANGTTYYYQVTAVNPVGEGPRSNEVSVTPTIPPIPAMPTGVTATGGPGVVNVSWNVSSGAASYNVKRSTTSGGPYTTVGSPAGHAYADANVAAGTTYYYVVSAVNAGGESANSAEVSATPSAALPAAPTNLTATGSYARVILNWTASSSANSYDVERSTTSGGPYTVVAEYVTGTTYTDYNVANDQTYYYVLASVNNVGVGPVSNEAAALPTEYYTLYATASAPVRSGSYADTALGGSASLYTWKSSNDTRYSLIKFDLSQVVGSVTKAQVRIYGDHNNTNTSYNNTDSFYPVLDDSWQQSTVTFNTLPALGSSSVGTTAITDDKQYYYWDVSSYVAAQQAAGKPVADLCLKMDTTAPDGTFNIYNSSTATSNLPVLLLTTSSPSVNVQVNFQPATSTTPAGWTADTGGAFNAASGMGWVSASSLNSGFHVPLSLTPNTADRGQSGVDPKNNTVIEMQYPTSYTNTGQVTTPGAWDIQLPNGSYTVTIGAGDMPDSTHGFDSSTVLNANGANVINGWVGSSSSAPSSYYTSANESISVTNGLMTIDPIGGTNSKMDYISISNTGVVQPQHPYITSSTPANNATGVYRNAAVGCNVDLVNPNTSIDPSTLVSANVYLIRNTDNVNVAGAIQTSGALDDIVFQPNIALEPSTQYTFHVTPGVKDTDGIAFLPYSVTFTTSDSSSVTTNPNVAFVSSIAYPTAGADYLKVGPNHELYASFPSGDFMRWAINADGSLSNPETFTGFEGRNLMGFAFDPVDPNLIWVVNDDPVYPQPATDFTGKLSKLELSGTGFSGSIQDYVVGFPRSGKDHMTNSVAFGPDGLLYLTQASNSAAGAPDSTWFNRSEHLLNCAVLQIDPTVTTGLPINVQTDDYNGVAGSYNPYAANAPVRLYADGMRNAFDLVWHSNGHLYTATNGTSAGGNTPASPDGSIPAIISCPVEDDYLYDVVQGEYYGHPNPTRGEYVMDGGNPTSGVDPQEVVTSSPYNGYPVGVTPPSNWGGYAWDYGGHASADGSIEYLSNTFGGALKHMLLTCEYSVGQDIVGLAMNANGKPTSETQVYGGLENPLDLAEDTMNGDLYVTEYPDNSFNGQIILLRPNTPIITATPSPLEFTQYLKKGASAPATLMIANNGLLPLTISSGGITLTGANAAQFKIAGMPSLPLTLQQGQSTTLTVTFTPAAAGLVQASVSIASNDPANPTLLVPMSGIGVADTTSASEPTLQQILNAYNIPVTVGSEAPVSGATGDEMLIPRFQKASTGSVTITPLASFGPKDSATGLSGIFGWYKAGQPTAKSMLFTISNTYAKTLSVQVNGTTTFDPGTQRFGMYVTWPADAYSTYQEDAFNTFAGALPHQVRVYPLKDTSGAVVPNAYIMAWKCSGSAYSFNDAVYIIRNVKPSQGYLTSQNLDGFPSNSWMAMNIVGDAADPTSDVYHNTSTLQVTNTQPDPVTVTSAQITGPFALNSSVSLPATLSSGQSLQLPVTFTANSGRVSNGLMVLQTTAPDELRIPVTLTGFWQQYDQDGLEPTLLEMINNMFGLKVNIGIKTYIFPDEGSEKAYGDEILSGYWQQANASTPITARQIAAWSGEHETQLWWYAQGASNQLNSVMQKNLNESQTVFPHLDGSTTQYAYATFNTNSVFGWKCDDAFSDDALNNQQTDLGNGATSPAGHHMRFYPASDQNGNLVPNAYIITMDYNGAPNYDFQDNVYYITGIKPYQEDLTAYVNPFVGTGTGTTVIGGSSSGDTFPGADTPFGMVQESPDTTSPNTGGYSYNSSTIVGFSHTHLSGAGGAFFGDVSLMPVAGTISGSTLGSQGQTFSHTYETAKAGYYSVTLQSSNTMAELTASPHVGWQRYTFPSGQQANVLINLANSFRGVGASTINIVDANDVEGSVSSYGSEETTNNNNPKPYTVYFHTHFDQPITAYGTWSGGTLTQNSATASGTNVAAYVTFGTGASSGSNPTGLVVNASTALSYVSLAGARANYAAEAPSGATFDSVHASTTALWNSYLHKIDITAATVGTRNTFYTALYHTLLYPSLYSDSDGTYTDWKGATQQATGTNEYANFSLWDTYRTEEPLVALIAPDVDHDMVQSLMDVYKATGYLPRWPLLNAECNENVGDSAVPFLVDAYEKGILGGTGYTPAQVYAAALNNATQVPPSGFGFDGRVALSSYITNGYVPYSTGGTGSKYHRKQAASETLEYALDDGVLSQMAATMGDTTNASALAARGKYYQNQYSSTNRFVGPRLSDGTFLSPFDATSTTGFYEGTPWQDEWLASQDPYGIISLNGGAANTQSMLDSFFCISELSSNPSDVLTNKWGLGQYYNPYNETDINAPYLYAYLGQPMKTAAVVRAQESLFNATSTGIPGNDDLGEMSAWYVMSALGIYPYAAGSPDYLLTAPLLPQATVHLNGSYSLGSALVINAPGASASTQYVQSVTNNGVQLGSAWIDHKTLTSGATLNYSLGTNSSTWGTQSSTYPPSVLSH